MDIIKNMILSLLAKLENWTSGGDSKFANWVAA